MTPSERMLREIAAEAEATASWTGRARFAPRVLAALAAVRREAFMPEALAAAAYENRPQPIGCSRFS
jgi:protein-L-isoaspartate(D-aspartate) O-methyltransferase